MSHARIATVLDLKDFADAQQYSRCLDDLFWSDWVAPPHGIRPISVMHDWRPPYQDFFSTFYFLWF